MNALEIQNLHKKLGIFRLFDINLTLPGGCIMGLIGENGAGKSTTMKLILNMLQKDTGSIYIWGDNQDILTDEAKEDIGFLLDEAKLPPMLTPRQLSHIMQYTYRHWDDDQYQGLLKKFELPPDRSFEDFSSGMKIKLHLAVAISHGSKLLLLDEPLGRLDTSTRYDVIEILRDFASDDEHSILISSHLIPDLEKLCDYVAILHKGKLLLCEEKDLLLSKYGMVHCTAEQLQSLDPSTILHKTVSPYDVAALMLRENIPSDFPVNSVSMEELFVYIMKEAR